MVPRPIDEYADKVIEMAGSHPSFHALLAKGIHLYKTENFVSARDVLNRGKKKRFSKIILHFGRSQMMK